MTSDPPRHSRLRRAAAKGFGPRVVAGFESWVQAVVSEVVDGIERLDRFDYVVEVAQTLPARVISRVLGLPPADEHQLVRWVTALFAALQETEGLEAGEGTGVSILPVMADMTDYAAKIREVKKAHPADDMFTALGRCVDNGELSEDEFLQWMMVMMGAGFETTHTTVSQSMRMCLESSEVAECVGRAIDDGLGDRVADEFIRLISPVIEMARTATRDVALAGERIRQGDVVVLYYASANRESGLFAEPDRFDPWRSETEICSFGTGPHRCIGANLARLQVRLLWEELHRRKVRLRLDGEPRRGWSVFINQLASLPVTREDAP